MAEIGVEEGIGFIPYAGIGLSAFKTLHADDVSPVRAAAAKMLIDDPDPETGQALVEASSDKSWVVKTAALEALGLFEDGQEGLRHHVLGEALIAKLHLGKAQ